MLADSGKLTGMRLPVERRSSTRTWAGKSSADFNHAMAVTFENSAAANRTPPVASPVKALTATDCDRTRNTAAESDRAHKDRHHGEQGCRSSGASGKKSTPTTRATQAEMRSARFSAASTPAPSPATANSLPTINPKVRPVCGLKAVPADQCCHVSSPPATAIRSAATAPPMSSFRQPAGGFSCAQPNQLAAKNPKIAAVAAASRVN